MVYPRRKWCIRGTPSVVPLKAGLWSKFLLPGTCLARSARFGPRAGLFSFAPGGADREDFSIHAKGHTKRLNKYKSEKLRAKMPKAISFRKWCIRVGNGVSAERPQ